VALLDGVGRAAPLLVVLDGAAELVGVETGVAVAVCVTFGVPVGSWADVMPNALAGAQLLATGTVGSAS
jgi:hypothetical protein